MKLIVVTRSNYFREEAEQLTAMFEAGLKHLHLRKEQQDIRMLHSLISSIPEIYHSKMIYHGEAREISKFRLGGIHLKESIRRINTAESLRNIRLELNQKRQSLSSSFHDIDEMDRTINELDYGLIGPLYDSISKENYGKNVRLQRTIPHSDKLIAIGGIEISKLSEIRNWNYSGVAVLGAIWMSTSPIIAFSKLHSAIKNLEPTNSSS